MTRSLLLSLAFLAATTTAFAQQAPYERILVPILILTATPGAFGSLWQTTLIGRNEGDVDATVSDQPAAPCTLCLPKGPRSTFFLRADVQNPNAGKFFYVSSAAAAAVNLSLRVQDISRQAQTWGTAIPVVRQRDTFTGKLELLDLPVDSRFRIALRVYDFEFPDNRQVRLRIYPVQSSIAVVDTVLTLATNLPEANFPYPDNPATAMIGDLVIAYPQIANIGQPGDFDPSGQRRLRMEIDPVTPGTRFWAFASITNDDTQHVTVVAPQQH
jgi:hypothetical protein